MERLPSADEREWLFDRLAELMAVRGFETFVASALVEPNERFFPDRWEPSEAGVRTLARRLLSYAGLGELGVAVHLYTNEADLHELDERGGAHSWSHEGAAAWFAGIRRGVCFFGADTNQFEQPEAIVGVMAHEVAHAYRHHHRIERRDRDEEERLTDLTTVYLGFGILTTNAAYRYRASGGMEGTMTVTRWSHARVGYLPPQAMSFLLAGQGIARGLNRGDLARVRRLLETNQAACFKAACRVLSVEQLAERLKLPDRAHWPEPSAQVAVLEPDDDEDERESEDDVEQEREQDTVGDVDEDAAAEPVGFNEGRPVFRIVRTAAGKWGSRGFMLGSLVGVIAWASAGVPLAAALAAGALGLVSGYLPGRRHRIDRCSDPNCEAPLGPRASICPGCGGSIMGEIRDSQDRLAAEEALPGVPVEEEYR